MGAIRHVLTCGGHLFTVLQTSTPNMHSTQLVICRYSHMHESGYTCNLSLSMPLSLQMEPACSVYISFISGSTPFFTSEPSLLW